MGAIKQRKERLQRIIDVLKAAPDQELTFKDLYGQFVLEWGITQKTMEKYVESLSAANLVDFGIADLTLGTFVVLVGGLGARKRSRFRE